MRVEGQELKSAGRSGLLLVKLALVIAAAGLFAYSLSGFAMPNGLPNYENWWLMMVAIGTILAALTFRTDFQTVGIIAATLIIGFSAQLALRTPFWHQHFRFVPSFLSYTMIAFLLIQVVVAAYYFWRQRIVRQLPRVFSEFGWIRSIALIAAIV